MNSRKETVQEESVCSESILMRSLEELCLQANCAAQKVKEKQEKAKPPNLSPPKTTEKWKVKKKTVDMEDWVKCRKGECAWECWQEKHWLIMVKCWKAFENYTRCCPRKILTQCCSLWIRRMGSTENGASSELLRGQVAKSQGCGCEGQDIIILKKYNWNTRRFLSCCSI